MGKIEKVVIHFNHCQLFIKSLIIIFHQKSPIVMKGKIVASIAFALLTQTSFAQHEHHGSGHAHHQNHSTVSLGSVDAGVKGQLQALLAVYYEMKDALVATDGKIASQKAETFLITLSKVESAKMSKAQQDFYTPLSAKLKDEVEHIQETNDTEHQRGHFETVSKIVFEVVKGFKFNQEDVFQQYCPMAFDNKGAFWLSNKSEIKNPYFGNKMLKCGSVKETIVKN